MLICATLILWKSCPGSQVSLSTPHFCKRKWMSGFVYGTTSDCKRLTGIYRCCAVCAWSAAFPRRDIWQLNLDHKWPHWKIGVLCGLQMTKASTLPHSLAEHYLLKTLPGSNCVQTIHQGQQKMKVNAIHETNIYKKVRCRFEPALLRMWRASNDPDHSAPEVWSADKWYYPVLQAAA